MQSAAFTFAIFEFVLLIFSLSFHECAHAWMASRLGDQTARLQGRLTLNPMSHIDPIGTLVFPGLAIFGPFLGLGMFSGMLIGWAKPTPVITRNFAKIKRDENLVTLAGPVSNLILALAATLVLLVLVHAVPGSETSPSGRYVVMATFQGHLLEGVNSSVQALALLGVAAIEINLSLFIFNLLPVPPLDGSHLMRNVLPYGAVQAYDRIPFWVSWVLMILVGGTIIRFFVGPALGVIFVILSRM
ncbi:site-2 protease family protein [Occallatibacter riparius]|uniref:Site-2 protease family protein n=1 Tax=Occallatibacter riparius TaxID=1002689 RepID=A0A9J7BSX0_9BACT|nr:site-2 protease family protein [Occallatibacter riparius]UWZ85972.1 site-2 protease family protein [Occallatibacter riparius]